MKPLYLVFLTILFSILSVVFAILTCITPFNGTVVIIGWQSLRIPFNIDMVSVYTMLTFMSLLLSLTFVVFTQITLRR